ncbi:MAG TPA: fibronectin type III domain-containing protein, partial [Candidatus Sulfotelmatobacter sp.]|nr:fibronectin type III domain-containing protein [Candidatus Sulfotelmatobacter sp.]
CLGVAQTPAAPAQAPAPGAAAGAAEITHGPVLEYVSDHDAKLAWTTKAPADMAVHFGTAPTSLTQAGVQAADAKENAGGTNHRASLTNLQPSTTYYVVVTDKTGNPLTSVVQFQTVAKGAPPKRGNVDLGK